VERRRCDAQLGGNICVTESLETANLRKLFGDVEDPARRVRFATLYRLPIER
jgi:hypothetical protein